MYKYARNPFSDDREQVLFHVLFKYLDWLAYRPISSHILYIYVSIS